ncbi:hypothetical protein CFC21_004738 [Triticum aestivum]|uniref:NB-ARC domain-containing protein n=2 Tax=Triticum aestivum TaxID=4565 RepID=A0A3B5YQ14_WHEAT|nr:disease resistance protein PIK6-NP-like [Triticum aestivum]KAF6987060.1 hypothetical protein CFC21_004738 [Triticum aestivum]
MDLATGAMVSLLPKLSELLKEEHKLSKGVKKDVEFLSRELTHMHVALHKVVRVPHDQELIGEVKLWADDAREVSYEMEDIIDSFLVPPVDSSAPADDPHTRLKRITKKMAKLFKKDKTRDQLVADAIKDIKDKVQKVSDRPGRYDVAANLAVTTKVDPRLSAVYKDTEIVGVEEPRDELVKRLTGGEDGVSKDQLKILSIFGFGGLGKTTLARAVYERLQGQYVRDAFVAVGRNPDPKKVLMDILLQLDKNKNYKAHNLAMLDEIQLIDELRGLLENKRYLIVIDDIWDIKAWEIIKCAFMDSNCGSRIITTTRILEVATITGDVYKLKALSHQKSEELFFTRLFGGKGECPYDEPTELSEKVLHKCGGVPLAIITIASLLAGKPKEYWSEVYCSIGFGNGDNEHVENTRIILSFSYYDLPGHLRTCLSYLSIYPEDYKINKETLIWKWIAEGFIHEDSGIGLFELGERYFNELVNRSMVQPVEQDGAIYACIVHDMVLDMIRSLSNEKNFVIILDGTEEAATSSRINARRLAIQKSIVEPHINLLSNTHLSQVRSFNATGCRFSTPMTLSLSSFCALRVLAMERCTFTEGHLYQPEHVGRLLQLRYLGLYSTRTLELPEEIGDLMLLQTPDLRFSGIKELPCSIGRLRQLKCLRADGESFRVPDWIGNLTSLEELSLHDVPASFMGELGKLTELRDLRFRIQSIHPSLKQVLVDSLCNLKKIQVLQMNGPWFNDDPNWEAYVPTPQLRRLVLWFRFQRLPEWITPASLPNLSHLTVEVASAAAHDVETLGRLPQLVSLDFATPYDMIFPAVGGAMFPRLVSCGTHVPLRFLPGAMLGLESVGCSVKVRHLKDAHMDLNLALGSLRNLPSLQRVKVEIRSFGATDAEVEETEAVLRHEVDIHPNHPVLRLSLQKC